jgi:hypothetical protein
LKRCSRSCLKIIILYSTQRIYAMLSTPSVPATAAAIAAVMVVAAEEEEEETGRAHSCLAVAV